LTTHEARRALMLHSVNDILRARMLAVGDQAAV